MAPARVSGDPDRGGGPAGGMFRGLSSWFGLEQPEAGDRQYQGDGQPKGDAPPEQRSEAVAESVEGELQEAGDQELLHQAKGLGSESPPASGTTEFRRAPASHLLGVGHQWSGVWGGERKVCLSLVRIWARPKPHLAVKSCA